jgi:hypothetical protein
MKKSKPSLPPARWDDVQAYAGLPRKFITPYFAIYPSKYMLLSARFVKRYLRDNLDRKYARLFYSHGNRALLIQFSDRESEHAVKLNLHHANLTLHIARFIRSFGLDISELTGKYMPELVQIPGHGPCWCIYLERRIR